MRTESYLRATLSILAIATFSAFTASESHASAPGGIGKPGTAGANGAPYDVQFSVIADQYSAKIVGNVTPNGEATSIWVQWGSTTDYGDSTPPQDVGNSTLNVSYASTVQGLQPGTLYHFRVVARNTGGTAFGADAAAKTVLGSEGHGKIVVPLTVSDTTGDVQTVYFGEYPTATFCMDTALGESPLPPPPPSFDVRFVSPRPYTTCFDLGTRIDLRQFIDSTQVDTFSVRINLGGQGTFPLTLAWPNLDTLFSNPVWLRDRLGGSLVNINMKNQTSFVIADTLGVTSLYIITGNGGAYTAAPHVSRTGISNLTQTSARISASVNSNGLGTKVWFEWGPTAQFGSTTSPDSIGAAHTEALVTDSLTGLSPRTVYHYRVDAQNSLGTTYGPEDSITTIADGEVGKYLVPLRITDTGIGETLLWFGVHPQATICLDPSLGEIETGPFPPGFDARMINLKCPALVGMTADIRPLADSAQVDSYMVAVQTLSEDYPITITWPDVRSYFNGPVRLVDRYGGIAVNVDMQSQNSVQIAETLWIQRFRIITGAPSPGQAPPAVLTDAAASLSSGGEQLNGRLDPNGSTSSVWFEWGTTMSYENSTPPQNAGSGSGVMAARDSISGLTGGATYHYRIVAQNSNGTMEGPDRTFTPATATSVDETGLVPKEFQLEQSYPNPFNPSATIAYAVPKRVRVSLRIYNVLGQVVATLVDREEAPGSYRLRWDAGNIASGIYFYKIVAGDFVQTRKMMLIR